MYEELLEPYTTMEYGKTLYYWNCIVVVIFWCLVLVGKTWLVKAVIEYIWSLIK
jgi:hypothetical protein